MSQKRNAIAVIGIDIGKNSLHVVGLDRRGAIMSRQKVSWPSSNSAYHHAALADRHGGLRRRTSPKPQTHIAWPRRSADASQDGPYSRGQKMTSSKRRRSPRRCRARR